ncbi:MAG: ribosomal protein S18-alanine N-acetyltransferase [Gemmatimonadaceae bacterium]
MTFDAAPEAKNSAAAITTRRAREADLEEVDFIEQASFADPWGRCEFSTALESPHTLFLVADDGSGAVCGYVIALAVADESEILNLAVTPECRGVGLGRALLDAAIDAARAKGAAQVWLEVRDSNAAARRLYESRGFSEISKRRRYYRHPVEDALVLKLAI